MVRVQLAAVCALVAAAVPSVAPAQSAPASFNYYTPPKLIKKGTATSPIGGAGTVVIKVLVNKDGTFKVQGVIHSSNAADDKAALEIAASSTYKPATRGSSKETAFYDFTLKFAGNGTSTTDEDLPEIEQYRRMMVAGNEAGAKTALQNYLGQHPEDAKAELYLAIADTRLNDSKDAVAALEKAGPVPEEYRAEAAKAYADAAIDAVSAKDTANAAVLARKAVDLSGTFDKYLVLGYVELAGGQLAPGTEALEKARDLAKTENATPKQQTAIYVNLVQAYARDGDFAKAKSAADTARQLDPSTNVDVVLEQAYISRGNVLQNGGKLAEAGALFEQAAAELPKSAGPLYARAALAYLAIKPDASVAAGKDPNIVKADADADKALAADPNNAAANYAKGIAVVDLDKSKSSTALDYLKKADDQAKKAGDTGLTAAIENAIKQLNGGK
jgi:tetratricopeptide (TPR) repeat protein